MSNDQVENSLSSSLSVDDLIAELQNLSDRGLGDHPIVIARQSNDYWRTVVCDQITDVSMETIQMEWSEYHRTVKVIDMNSDGFDEEELFGDFEDEDELNPTKAVVINFSLCE